MLVHLGIQEMDACGIGRIAVGDESDLLFWRCSSDSLIHGNNGMLSSPVIGHVISGDFQVMRGDEEKDVMMFTHDLYISFITCGD